MSAPAKDDSRHITVQKDVEIKNDIYYLKSAAACPFSGPAAVRSQNGRRSRPAQWPEILADAG